MTSALAPRRWVIRVIPILILFYSAWWLAGVGPAFSVFTKIVLESLAPLLIDHVESIRLSVNGGWKVVTSIHPINDPATVLSLEIKEVFLNKAIVWVPAALAMILASEPSNLKKITLGAALVIAGTITILLVCVAAYIAVMINPTAAILDDKLLPPPINMPLDTPPHPSWYFHLVTFANYLGMLIAPLAMPVIIWVSLCHREIAKMLTPNR